MTLEPERHPASGMREEYEKRLAIWHQIVKEPLFKFLKHDTTGRKILCLLANGQISLGKCAEAITEKFCLGIDPDLPEWKGYSKMTTKTKRKERDWPEPKESGIVRDTTEYRWAVEELGQGREVSFKVQPIARVKRPGEALCQALRRHIRASGLLFRVYSRKGVIYIRKE